MVNQALWSVRQPYSTPSPYISLFKLYGFLIHICTILKVHCTCNILDWWNIIKILLRLPTNISCICNQKKWYWIVITVFSLFKVSEFLIQTTFLFYDFLICMFTIIKALCIVSAIPRLTKPPLSSCFMPTISIHHVINNLADVQVRNYWPLLHCHNSITLDQFFSTVLMPWSTYGIFR